MTSIDRFLLQADSVIIVLFFVIYLFKALNSGKRTEKDKIEKNVQNELSAAIMPIEKKNQKKTGYTKGEAEISGVDDETACAILAAVSMASNISLDSLKVKSIKAIE